MILKVIFLAILLNFSINSQTAFQNILVSQIEDTVKIQYELWGGYESESYFVELDVSSDGGTNFNILPKLPKGDVGFGIKKGQSKQILWEPLKENIEMVGDKYIFRLKLSVPGSSIIPEFVKIIGGEFNIGDPFNEGDFDERMIVPITLSSFEISKFEISNVQYSSFLKIYKSDRIKSGEFEGEKMIYENEKGLKLIQGNWKPVVGYENFPVVGVTWYGALEFCRYYKYRLPTEAEWEFAAREFGQNIRYGNGKNNLNTRDANYCDLDINEIQKLKSSIIGSPQSIGAYAPNNLGLFQMSGNVWEWCLDWYKFNYDTLKTINPVGPWFGKYKVIRGGSFLSTAKAVRNFERSFLAPYKYSSDVGFRVVRSIDEEKLEE